MNLAGAILDLIQDHPRPATVLPKSSSAIPIQRKSVGFLPCTAAPNRERLLSEMKKRVEHTFGSAAAKSLAENQRKRSIADDVMHLRGLEPFIGTLPLRRVHLRSLQPFIAKRRADGAHYSRAFVQETILRHRII